MTELDLPFGHVPIRHDSGPIPPRPWVQPGKENFVNLQEIIVVNALAACQVLHRRWQLRLEQVMLRNFDDFKVFLTLEVAQVARGLVVPEGIKHP